MKLPIIPKTSNSLASSILNLQETGKSILVTIPDSSLVNSIREMKDLAESFSISLQNSAPIHAIKKLQKSTNALALSIQDSTLSKAIQEMQESAKAISLSIQDSSLVNTIHGLQESSALASLAIQNSSLIEQVKALQDIPYLQAIREIENSPFHSETINFVIDCLDHFDEQPINPDNGYKDDVLAKFSNEIYEDLETNKNFLELSEKSKNLLIYIYHTYILPIIIGCLVVMITNNQEKAQEQFDKLKNKAEIKSLTRKQLDGVDRDFLKGYRVVTGSDLQLRVSPNMSAQVLEKLPLGLLIKIIDRSNRVWLFVEVEIDGEILQGWVARRYTTYFK